MLEAIVGIEVRVTSLQGKWKLSQNRSAVDVAGAIAGLRSRGSETTDTVAQEMARVTGV
jgi:transcriptional regulator